MIIETERLILRQTKIDDASEFSAYNQDENFYRFLPIELPTVESTIKFVKDCIEKNNNSKELGKYHFTIVERSSGKVIGDISISLKDKEARCSEIGYGLNPLYWGKGYMSEAMKAVIDFGFGELGLKRIYATADPDNKGSTGVMKKCGMLYESCHKCEKLIRNEFRDSVYYAILDDDWSN